MDRALVEIAAHCAREQPIAGWWEPVPDAARNLGEMAREVIRLGAIVRRIEHRRTQWPEEAAADDSTDNLLFRAVRANEHEPVRVLMNNGCELMGAASDVAFQAMAGCCVRRSQTPTL